eukprot:scaffold21443_cov53-Attheya_sp.AAC.1
MRASITAALESFGCHGEAVKLIIVQVCLLVRTSLIRRPQIWHQTLPKSLQFGPIKTTPNTTDLLRQVMLQQCRLEGQH